MSREEIEPDSGEEVLDAEGLDLIPGMTDEHFHGCMSYDLCDASWEAIQAMAKWERSQGVTQICPATMTLSEESVHSIVKTAYDYAKGQTADDEARLVGVHMEGPFISPDRVGAQNPEFVHLPDADFLEKLEDETHGFVRIVTIAPETEGAIDCIRKLSGRIRFSIGHTMTDYDTAKKAFDAGAGNLTHLYNAMPGIHHRKPGPIVAGWEHGDVFAEIISDGVHIHPASVRTAFRLFGAEHMILISDSTRAAGMEDGQYELGGQPIFKHDGAAYLADGTLAGSTTSLWECCRNAIRFGIPKEDAIRAATYNPAKAVGILQDYGTIEKEKCANMVLSKKDGTIVRVFSEREK